MKLLITGGSGFIGSHLVQSFKEKGDFTIDILDIKKPPKEVYHSINRWVNKDIRQPLYDVIKNYDAVYHLAAVANARTCGENPRQAYEINVVGTFNVADACRKNKIPRVLYASTIWMSGLQVGEVVTERSPFEIHKMNTIYGATKLSGELIFSSMFAEHGGPKYTIMRYGIPYGERMWGGLIVRAFLYQAEKFGMISIFGDGLQGRNFLYIGDMCNAQTMLLDKKCENKIYNLGSPQFITVKEIAEELVKHYPAKISYITQARVEPKLKNVSSRKASVDLHWKQETDLREGIRKCVDWWKTLSSNEKEDKPYFVPKSSQ